MARKLKFAHLLSIVQVIITAILTLWADRVDWMAGETNRPIGPYGHIHLAAIKARYIWRGVNAPTCPLCLAWSSNHPILGFSAGELLYLAAVASLWYLVGRFLDRHRGLQPPESLQITLRKSVFAVSTTAWGMVLLSWSLLSLDSSFPGTFSGPRVIRPENVIIYALFLLWSFLLITIPARKLIRAVGRRKTNS